MHLYPNKNTTDNSSNLKKEFASENSEDNYFLKLVILDSCPHGHIRLFLKYVAKLSCSV